jgi:hypothetical protein
MKSHPTAALLRYVFFSVCRRVKREKFVYKSLSEGKGKEKGSQYKEIVIRTRNIMQ